MNNKLKALRLLIDGQLKDAQRLQLEGKHEQAARAVERANENEKRLQEEEGKVTANE
jgi:hypothetical protein